MSIEVGAIREILTKALQVERDGYTFYSMVAEQATEPAVRDVFQRLARDETEHQAYLKGIMRRLEEVGVEAFSVDPRAPDLGEYSSAIFTEEFRAQARGVDSAAAVLSIGIQLESNAVGFFSDAASAADDPQAKGFFRFLADWEGEHLRILQRLLDRVHSDLTD